MRCKSSCYRARHGMPCVKWISIYSNEKSRCLLALYKFIWASLPRVEQWYAETRQQCPAVMVCAWTGHRLQAFHITLYVVRVRVRWNQAVPSWQKKYDASKLRGPPAGCITLGLLAAAVGLFVLKARVVFSTFYILSLLFIFRTTLTRRDIRVDLLLSFENQ